MDASSDALLALITKAQSGDAQAKEALFAQCRAFLSMVADAELNSGLLTKVDASDLVQESLLEADKGLANFRGCGVEEWHAWLRRIVRHNAVDLNRHFQGAAKRDAKRERSMHAADPDASGPVGWEPAGQDPTPSQEVMRSEEAAKTLELLSQLPTDYQEVLRLRNLESLPFEVVAEKMGRARPAVQMLWTRAVRKLRELMSEDESTAI